MGFFTGLDIGTSSIKVLVAELVNGEVNVIGVSNAKSKGVKDGIIVDIEAAATAIKSAISQAEEKAGISIKSVNVGLPANLLQVEPTQGMIPVTSDTKEITDQDVENVVKSALTKSMTPDREVITFIPEEFVVDGFQGIRDPRGMMGVRLEMRGLLYTGPRTILHNLRKTVERVGVQVDNVIISPLAMVHSVLNESKNVSLVRLLSTWVVVKRLLPLFATKNFNIQMSTKRVAIMSQKTFQKFLRLLRKLQKV